MNPLEREFEAGRMEGRKEGYKKALMDLSWPIEGIPYPIPQSVIGGLQARFERREKKPEIIRKTELRYAD